jgi:hypothetical protein
MTASPTHPKGGTIRGLRGPGGILLHSPDLSTLPCIIQMLASRQWQPAPRFWIDILRRGYPKPPSSSRYPDDRILDGTNIMSGQTGLFLITDFIGFTASPASSGRTSRTVTRLRPPS